MEIEFALTEEDIVEFADFHATRGVPPEERNQGVLFLSLFLFVVVGCLVLDISVSSSNRKPLNWWRLGAVGGVGLLFAVILVVSLLSRPLTRRSVRRTLRRPGNERALAMRRVGIAADGVSERDEFGATKFTPWTAILRIESTNDHAFIFRDRNTALAILPRRAFSSESDFRTFVEAARRFLAQTGPQKFSEAPRSAGSDHVSENPSPASGQTDLTAGAGGQPHGD
jgi:hypothetical protein